MSSQPEKTILKIKLIPRASRNELVGYMEDGTLKIKITAPPVEGQANLALIKLLADLLKVTNSTIEVISGKTSRTKLISISGMDKDSIYSIIKTQIS